MGNPRSPYARSGLTVTRIYPPAPLSTAEAEEECLIARFGRRVLKAASKPRVTTATLPPLLELRWAPPPLEVLPPLSPCRHSGLSPLCRDPTATSFPSSSPLSSPSPPSPPGGGVKKSSSSFPEGERGDDDDDDDDDDEDSDKEGGGDEARRALAGSAAASRSISPSSTRRGRRLALRWNSAATKL